MRSKLSLSLSLLAAVVLLAGCHTVAWQVASSENVYYDLLRSRTVNCSAAVDPKCLPCRDSLQKVYDDLQETGAAMKRGGSIKPQFDHVKESLKKAKKDCTWAAR